MKGRRGTRICKKLALAAGGLVIGLGVAEVLVRAFVPVRNVGPSFTVYDPVYGKRLKRNFTCSRITPEFTMQFTTNSLAYRGPEPDTFPHRPILFLGDSFTMGYGVNDGEEFPALVRRLFADRSRRNRIPVINAAVGDNGTGRWVKFLRTEGPPLDPCYVVLQVCGNDFSDNIQERLFRIDTRGELVEMPGPPRPGLKRVVQGVIEAVPGIPYLHVVSLFREVRLRKAPAHTDHEAQLTREASGPLDASGDRLTYCLIDEIVNICREQDWPLLVVIVAIEGGRLEHLRGVLRQSNVPYALVPQKSEHPDLYYAVDGHWNTAGHVYVADLIARHLLGKEAFWNRDG